MVRHQNDDLEETRTLLRLDGVDRLLPVLRQGVYHLTGIQGYAGIRGDGYIKPNDGRFTDTFGQSAGSYGRHHGYVSLFDFESPTETRVLQQYHNWDVFLTRHKPITILIRLDRRELLPKLISYEQVVGEADIKMTKIPYVEAWYPKPIPFSWATKLVLITPEKPVQFRVLDAKDLSLDEENRLLKEQEELARQSATESKLQRYLRLVKLEESP